MATIKQRLLKKNSSGTYDTIHLETSMDCLTGILPVSKGGTGVTSIDALKTALGVTGATPSTTTIALGGTVSMASFDWICVHSTTEYYYLMTKYVIGNTAVGSTNTYAGSQAALMCFLFGTAIGVWGNSKFASFTNDGVSAYCHLPTCAQMNGGFSYFSSNSRRIGTNPAGTAVVYWTSSPVSSSNDVYCVYTDGNFSNYGYTYSYGFRPVVCLKR